jgi:hypothetical protein
VPGRGAAASSRAWVGTSAIGEEYDVIVRNDTVQAVSEN